MYKLAVYYIKLLLLLIVDLIHRFKKYLLYIYHGNHEFERICTDPCDLYEKTIKMERWLSRTNCEKIRDFWLKKISYQTADETHPAQKAALEMLQDNKEQVNDQTKTNRRGKLKGNSCKESINLEDADVLLNQAIVDTIEDLLILIKQVKRAKLKRTTEKVLRSTIQRIINYNFSLIVVLKIASSPYDPNLNSHTKKLMNLWNNLVRLDKIRSLGGETGDPIFPDEIRSEITDDKSIVSSRWSHIGFQGEDPGTDFRGMGLLGLEQLEYLSRRAKYLGLNLLKSSLSREHGYPLAIVGINITFNLLDLFRDGSMKHLYYDSGDSLFRNQQGNLNLVKTFNDLYIELFLRFDCFWHESKPENIFAFRELMGKFIDVIKMDLCDRTFSFKFIY